MPLIPNRKMGEQKGRTFKYGNSWDKSDAQRNCKISNTVSKIRQHTQTQLSFWDSLPLSWEFLGAEYSLTYAISVCSQTIEGAME